MRLGGGGGIEKVSLLGEMLPKFFLDLDFFPMFLSGLYLLYVCMPRESLIWRITTYLYKEDIFGSP